MPAHLILRQRLDQAIATSDDGHMWEAYKACWEGGDAPPMTVSIFAKLFDTGRHSGWVEVIRRLPQAVDTLKPIVDAMALPQWSARQIWFIVLGAESAVATWVKRRHALSAGDRAKFARDLMQMLLEEHGRDWVRSRVLTWWASTDLLEEEREQIVIALADGGALTRNLLVQFGPLAARVAAMRIARGEPLFSAAGTTAPCFASSKVSLYAAARLNDLIDVMDIETDVLDAKLSATELARVGGETPSLGAHSLLANALDRLRHEHPFGRRVADVLQSASTQPAASRLTLSHSASRTAFAVPLIRVLHMRLILETPALAHALANPQDHILPEVLLYTLGRDEVVYCPAIRVMANGDRRWRAKWVESSGEALAALFLESALDLDLTLLRRIPEGAEETPDFMCGTRGETGHVVFESKGSTDWRTHLDQRSKALSQIRKEPRPKRRAPASWKSASRAFACCLFAARQGESRASLLNIVDPPPGFSHLFEPGWQEAARRQHYTAVAQASGLWPLASSLSRGQGDGPGPETQTEPATFVLGGDGPNASIRFRGASVPLVDRARQLQHPQAESFNGVHMFVGMTERLYASLTRGVLPTMSDLETTTEGESHRLPVSTGVIPAEPDTPEPRGVYSLLADGSFLAFYVSE